MSEKEPRFVSTHVPVRLAPSVGHFAGLHGLTVDGCLCLVDEARVAPMFPRDEPCSKSEKDLVETTCLFEKKILPFLSVSMLRDRRQFTKVNFGLGHGLDMGLEVISEGHVVEKNVWVSMLAVESLFQQSHRLAHLVQVLVLQEYHKRSIHSVCRYIHIHIHVQCRLVIVG